MTSEQITNKQIKQFIDSYIKGKKDVYFLITTGSFYDQKFNFVHPKGLEYTGEKKFLEQLEVVLDENPYQMGVSLFEKANKNIKKEPFLHKIFVLHKEKPKDAANNNNSLNGIGIEGFGGIEGILDTKLSSKYLTGENERLKKQNDTLVIDNKKLNEKVSILKEKVSDFKEEVKTKDWEFKVLHEDHKRIIDNLNKEHQRELDGIEQKGARFEKLLTVGGLVAAKAAGLNEGDLKGILGIEDDNAIEETNTNTNSNANSSSNVNFEEVKEYSGKKAEAKELIDIINQTLIDILDKNNDENAFKLIASFYNIFGHANSSIENLTQHNDLVVSNNNNTKQDTSVADKIIEQANNYQNNQE